METLVKCAALAVGAAVIILFLKKNSSVFAVLASIAAVCMLAVSTLEFLKPVLAFGKSLQETAGLSGSVTAPVYKALAIGFLTQAGASICEDAGEKAIASGLQLCGQIAALYVSLPLFQSVLHFLKELL